MLPGQAERDCSAEPNEEAAYEEFTLYSEHEFMFIYWEVKVKDYFGREGGRG